MPITTVPPGTPIPLSLKADFRYCRDIVRSRQENFPVGSLLLAKEIRPFLYAVYAFARMADDFADFPGREPAERLQLLDDWSRRLQRAETRTPDHPIFRALSYTFEVTGIPSLELHHLLTAFRMDVTNKRYDSVEQLLEYCHYSANPIGRIMLHIAGEQDPDALIWSDAICTALQLTNHWQDLGQDAWNGRPLYLPQHDMQRFGVSEKLILERRFSPAVGELMLFLIEITRRLFQQGEPLLRHLAWPFNLEVALTWEAGNILLDRMEATGGNTLRLGPRLGAMDWVTCFLRATRRTVTG